MNKAHIYYQPKIQGIVSKVIVKYQISNIRVSGRKMH